MKIKLNKVRLSFPDLFEAVQYQGSGPFNYGAQFLIPADSTLKKSIDAAIQSVAKEKWGAKAAAILTEILPDKKACCWIDGNRREYDGYAGNWAISAKRLQDKGAPLVLDTNKSALTAKSGRIYAGCYVNASIEIYAQDSKNGKGIRCELLAVQFDSEGDSFGGGTAPSADDFDDLAVGADAEELV